MSNCSNCNKPFYRGKFRDGKWYCEDCLGYRINSSDVYEFMPTRVKEDRKKYAKDLIQPYRSGEFSKEFKDSYPKQAKEMLDSGTISKKQFKDAKEVWR